MEHTAMPATAEHLHLSLASAEDVRHLQRMLDTLRPGGALHLTVDRPTGESAREAAPTARPHASYADAMRAVEASYYDAV